jgi:gluconolactonase
MNKQKFETYTNNFTLKQIGYIKMPERVSNVEFGGLDGKTLFITASTSLYMASLSIKGAKFK